MISENIDIVLPSGLDEASASSLKLCELFMERLLKSELNEIDLSVDVAAKVVNCRNAQIKEAIYLIYRAGKIESFRAQIISLLHTSLNKEALGELVCVQDGINKKFTFFENGKLFINWKIVTS